MKKLIAKLHAHTDQLVGCLLGMKEKYAFLEPMLFDKDVVEKYCDTKRLYGFNAIKCALFYACVQDLTRMAFDNDRRTPSIAKIIGDMENTPELVKQFQGSYSSWGRAIAEEGDELTKRVLEQRNTQEEERLTKRFYEEYEELLVRWREFKRKPFTAGFRVIRDKLTAHLELRLNGDMYQRTDISELGLKWGDLRRAIVDVEWLVLRLNLLVRGTDVALEVFDKELEEHKNEFW